MTSSGEQHGIVIGNAKEGGSGSSSVSSSSSLNSSPSSHDLLDNNDDTATEDDHTIAAVLAEDQNSLFNHDDSIGQQQQQQHRLGRRLSHLDSIPVRKIPPFLVFNSASHFFLLLFMLSFHFICIVNLDTQVLNYRVL